MLVSLADYYYSLENIGAKVGLIVNGDVRILQSNRQVKLSFLFSTGL